MSIQADTLKSSIINTSNELKDASLDISTEFKAFVSDIEGLLKETASLSGDDFEKAKGRIIDRINLAKKTIGEANKSLIQQARESAELTNRYVHEQPWRVLGAGVTIGFLVGLLLGRRN
jgi:ElaB protein